MKELLERWAALEPERVKRRWDGCLGVAYDDGGLVLEERPGTYGSPEFHKFAGIYVQAAVQEAIEARGWNWEAARKGKWPDGAWMHTGHVWHPFSARPDEFGYSRQSPAEALLSAYLTAVEAQG
jgi:hypothetical protein